jgi:hypothetical protein
MSSMHMSLTTPDGPSMYWNKMTPLGYHWTFALAYSRHKYTSIAIVGTDPEEMHKCTRQYDDGLLDDILCSSICLHIVSELGRYMGDSGDERQMVFDWVTRCCRKMFARRSRS